MKKNPIKVQVLKQIDQTVAANLALRLKPTIQDQIASSFSLHFEARHFYKSLFTVCL